MSSATSVVDAVVSIYLPYCLTTTTASWVKDFFEKELKYGRVRGVKSKRFETKEGTPFQAMRVYFERWNLSDEALAFKQKLIDGEKVRVVYGKHNTTRADLYWMAELNKATEEQQKHDLDALERRRESYEQSRDRDEPRRRERSPVRRDERRRDEPRRHERSPVRRDERRRDGWQQGRRDERRADTVTRHEVVQLKEQLAEMSALLSSLKTADPRTLVTLEDKKAKSRETPKSETGKSARWSEADSSDEEDEEEA